MDRLLFLLRICILVLSCYGYLQLISRIVKPDFSVGILFCSIGSIMFLSGILNIMAETAVTEIGRASCRERV